MQRPGQDQPTCNASHPSSAMRHRRDVADVSAKSTGPIVPKNAPTHLLKMVLRTIECVMTSCRKHLYPYFMCPTAQFAFVHCAIFLRFRKVAQRVAPHHHHPTPQFTPHPPISSQLCQRVFATALFAQEPNKTRNLGSTTTNRTNDNPKIKPTLARAKKHKTSNGMTARDPNTRNP